MFQMFPIPWPGNFGKLLVLAAVALDGDTGSLVVWFPPRKSPAAIGPVLYSLGGVKGVMPNPTFGVLWVPECRWGRFSLFPTELTRLYCSLDPSSLPSRV